MVENEEWIWTGVYTLLSIITRFWRIGAANYVVWDEVCSLICRVPVRLTDQLVRRTLANSAPIISTATSTLMSIHPSARCW
jgi:hypothetical protein